MEAKHLQNFLNNPRTQKKGTILGTSRYQSLSDNLVIFKLIPFVLQCFPILMSLRDYKCLVTMIEESYKILWVDHIFN